MQVSSVYLPPLYPDREPERIISLVLTDDEVKMLKMGRENIEHFMDVHGLHSDDEAITCYVFPLLDAIDIESKGKNK